MNKNISQFEKSYEFYNLIYNKKDSQSEAIYIDNFIRKYTKNTHKILF